MPCARAARVLDRGDDRAQPDNHHDGDLLGELSQYMYAKYIEIHGEYTRLFSPSERAHHLCHGLFLVPPPSLRCFRSIVLQGQLAGCDSDADGDYDQYSCTHKSAMRGVAAFASIIWILQVRCRAVPVQATHIAARVNCVFSSHPSFVSPV